MCALYGTISIVFIHSEIVNSYNNCSDGDGGDGGGDLNVESPFQFEWPPNSI